MCVIAAMLVLVEGGLLRVVIVIIAVPLILSWSAETSRSLDR